VEREQGSGAGWGSEPAHRVTPEVVQSKEFGSARLRVGYVMHEVDEFLDQVTDTLAALLAENERLRARPGASAAPPPADASDRAAVDAFLQREKAFLQDLGALVQTHTEQLKSMVRSARASAAEVVERPAPAGHDAPGPAAVAPASAVAPEVAPEPPRQVEPPIASEPPAADASPEPAQPEPVAPAADGEDVEAILDASDDTGAIAPVEAEEPIRVDEPEPARSRRSEEGGESSLRELFWGEE
jgi:DivIVA domain-containing protein